MNEENNDNTVENNPEAIESGSEAQNSSDRKECENEAENGSDRKEYEYNTENKIEDGYFIKNAVLGDYEVSINSINLKNPAAILEKLYPLKDDETLTNEEKSQQVMNIILEYME